MGSRIKVFLYTIIAVGLVAGNVNAADITSGLLAYWVLDDDVKDSVGGHDGVLVGGAEFVQDNERGKVLEVNGVDGHAVVPHSADIVFANTDSYTLSVWVNVLTAPGHWAGIVDKSRDISPWYGLWINPSNQWVGGGTNIIGSVIETNTWIHLALVQDADTNRRLVYVDGELNIQGTAISSTGSGELWMGGAKGLSEYLHGRIDDVAIYGRALSEDDVKALAQGSDILGFAVEPHARFASLWSSIRQ
jgi:hypothetical protein